MSARFIRSASALLFGAAVVLGHAAGATAQPRQTAGTGFDIPLAGEVFDTTLITLPVGFYEPPTEGMWWSSAEPGTGVAFNVDSQGRWFAAIYLYQTDGKPTFLTMQGDAVEYLPSSTGSVYARARSRLIESTGGQCLKCPWRQATAAFTEVQAEITFYGRNRAELIVGDWTLKLAPLPQAPATWNMDRYSLGTGFYRVTAHSATRNTVIVAQTAPVIVIGPPPGQEQSSDYSLLCVDCRVQSGDGNASPEQGQALQRYLESFVMRCDRNTRLNCQTVSRADAGFVVHRELVDEHGKNIVLLDYGQEGVRDPAKITIEALPADWTPTLPQ